MGVGVSHGPTGGGLQTRANQWSATLTLDLVGVIAGTFPPSFFEKKRLGEWALRLSCLVEPCICHTVLGQGVGSGCTRELVNGGQSYHT